MPIKLIKRALEERLRFGLYVYIKSLYKCS